MKPRSFLLPEAPGPTLEFEVRLPLEALAGLSFSVPVPLESKEPLTRRASVPVPLEALKGLSFRTPLALEVPRGLSFKVSLPLEAGGELEDAVIAAFLVLKETDSPIIAYFEVVLGVAELEGIEAGFDVFPQLDGIDAVFDVVKKSLVDARKGDDIQMPIGYVKVARP